LLQAGFPENQLSFLAGDTRRHETPDIGPVLKESESESGEDVFKGAAIGLAVGIVSLFLPGIGPVLAAGPLAAYVGGIAGELPLANSSASSKTTAYRKKKRGSMQKESREEVRW